MKVHHIGYLVKYMNKSVVQFEKLGYTIERPLYRDLTRGIHIIFLQKDDYRIELIEPSDTTSKYHELLKRYKNTAYHICYEVDSVADYVTRFKKDGYTVLEQPTIAPALGGVVTFMLHPFMGIIELFEAGEK